MATTAESDSAVIPARSTPTRAVLSRFEWPPIALAVVALGALAWFGRDMTFYHDEFAFLLMRDLSPTGILAPHNEHLSATLVLLYRGLLATVGTVSYWPYLGVTFALHIAVAGIVYVVVRREAGVAFALGAMAIMLFLGSGGDNILWAFQSGTIGSTAAGMAAVVIAPRRPAVAALLIGIGLATSGAALAFLVATAFHLLLTRPRAIAWLVLPVLAYLAWYVGFAATRMVALRSPSLEGVPEYVLAGLTASAAGAVGTAAPVAGQVVLVALAFGLGFALTRRVPPVVLAMLLASVAFFAIAGLVRAHLGAEQAMAPRYVYIAVPGVLIAGAVLLARLPTPVREVAGIAVFTVAFAGNLVLMGVTHDRLASKIECERAMTPIARGSAGNPC